MRWVSSIIALVCSVILMCTAVPTSWAADYHQRYIRNYPPGYHGMYYYAERFFDTDPNLKYEVIYRWDDFMSRVTEIRYPFHPIPYDWEYGKTRNFNLPDYNANDWR